MKIGEITINSKLALASMVGMTDLGFRTVCRELGAGCTAMETVSVETLCYQGKESLPLLELGGGKHPAAVQLFNGDPYYMEQAAGIATEKSGTDILDINMGCPVPKVANSGDDSGLMRNPELAVKVAKAAIQGVGGRPATVKSRLGWDKGSINCAEFARAMETTGVAAVAIRGRTKAQIYSGRADWDYIRAVEEAVPTPVLVNDDVFKPEDVVYILKYTRAGMAMLGRGCLGNPWLFVHAQVALRERPVPPLPPPARRCGTAVRQFRLSATQKGEYVACLGAQKHYAWYLKGVPYAGHYKEQISKISTLEDIGHITTSIQRNLRGRPPANMPTRR